MNRKRENERRKKSDKTKTHFISEQNSSDLSERLNAEKITPHNWRKNIPRGKKSKRKKLQEKKKLQKEKKSHTHKPPHEFYQASVNTHKKCHSFNDLAVEKMSPAKQFLKQLRSMTVCYLPQITFRRLCCGACEKLSIEWQRTKWYSDHIPEHNHHIHPTHGQI